ncbi:Ig-like domain-containing surface protein (fragment) [Candidatus Desulfosporosinus infrequens]|uniref:Ig-like domain-containing surface protein n=1 Tax=Candidatus Desulfosporosinus infrequens TaxID=2043169 RepID=A0A2U3KW46_9FIRM
MMLTNKVLKLVLVLIISITSLAANPFQALANGETTMNLTQLQEAIKVDMIDRESNFTIHYDGNSAEMMKSLGDVTKQAEGSDDYLSLSWKNIGYKISGVDGNADINFTMDYLTTKAQEDYVDAQVKQIVPTLITSTMTDFEKEKAIHDWIIKNVSYDYVTEQRTAYAALKTGKTVCAGYAMLTEKMMTEAGVNSIIVTGSIPGGLHAWNMVQVGGNWYQFDATNDAVSADTTKYYNKTDDYMTQCGFVWDKTKFPQAVTN